ncbi:MAG: cation:proton antiporter [Bacteroidota bacterium]|nr:cation:proton antiporter [Bacteroidota bacterium]MDP3145324.1 cation:proton antiporter [Bacteroidota bacterium]MDP3557607.1 cation:proton antiporter [Bacteroidota bacterium]
MYSLQNYFLNLQQFFNHYLPLKNPVLILAITLLIILFSPLLFKRFKIPGIIGLIISGVLIGPNSLHIIESTNSFELLSKTGLLYIMFLAGLEIDMQEFRQNRKKSIVFGALTFIIPITIGYLVCIYVFHFSLWSSVLLASMFSTHTLLSYPIVSNMGIIKNRAVQIAFGGTIITDSAVLILLGIITNVVTGEMDITFWIKITVSLSLLFFSTLYLLPKISRWFFRNIEAQASSHYIYVLAVVFISGFLSELAGVEPIIGAFLAGLGLNKVIPHSSILMNRIVFIGNTLFIPFFLISAGMLVDLKLFFNGGEALMLAGLLCAVGIITKYFAAWITGFIYNFSKPERNLIFGLSVSHAAATLAIIKVGFDIGLFNQSVINATIILILISCLVSSFVSERAARQIAVLEKDVVRKTGDKIERILIPVSNPENIQRLIDFSLLVKDQNSSEPIFPLSIVEDDADADEKLNIVRKVIEGAVEQISSGDKKVEVLKKVDLSIVDGIVRTAKAYNITDILISFKAQQGPSNLIFGNISENLLSKSKQAIIISKILQPLNTFKRIVVVLTPNAELENGFIRMVVKLNSLLKQIGNEAYVYGNKNTIDCFCAEISDKKKIFFKYIIVESFEDFEQVSNPKEDDLFVLATARKQTVSYDFHVDEMSKKLNKNHEFTSFAVFYPEISKTLQDGRISTITSPSLEQKIEKVKHLTEKITGIFKKDEDKEI